MNTQEKHHGGKPRKHSRNTKAHDAMGNHRKVAKSFQKQESRKK